MKKIVSPARYLTLFMLLLCCLSLTGCRKSDSVTITVAGIDVPIKGKLQTCMDNGLITTNSSGEEITLETTLKGREVSFDIIRLGISQAPHKTPVYVNCFNMEESEKSVYDCSILSFHYDAVSDNADQAPVLINGIDFWGMTEDEALDALKALKIKADDDTMRESHSVTFETGQITWTVKSEPGRYFNGDSSNPQKEVKEFDDETFYISSVDLSIANTLRIRTK